MFQVFPGHPSVGNILLSLVLGFAAFFLFVLLITMVCVTLVREDQILVTSDTVPLVEETEYFDNCEITEEETKFNSKNCLLRISTTLYKLLLVPSHVFTCIFNLQTLPGNDYIDVI